MDKPTAPADDLAAMDHAAAFALSLYAADGAFPPFAIIDTPTGSIIVPADDMSDSHAKAMFANILRHLSIKKAGIRTAFAFEAWTLLSADPDAIALMDEIRARGGSLQEHPDAGEAITVIVETDAGATLRQHRIVRDGDEVTLDPAEDSFIAVDSDDSLGGLLSDFHVPSSRRDDPDVRAFSLAMSLLVQGEIQPIDPVEADPATPEH